MANIGVRSCEFDAFGAGGGDVACGIGRAESGQPKRQLQTVRHVFLLFNETSAWARQQNTGTIDSFDKCIRLQLEPMRRARKNSSTGGWYRVVH